MTYYVKESYKAGTVTLDNAGEPLLLRDDVAGDDAQAGDGFYTVKINADAKRFQ